MGLGQLPPSYSGNPVIHFMCIIMILSPRDIFSNFTKKEQHLHSWCQTDRKKGPFIMIRYIKKRWSMSISICYSKYVGNLDSGKKMYSGKNVNNEWKTIFGRIFYSISWMVSEIGILVISCKVFRSGWKLNNSQKKAITINSPM